MKKSARFLSFFVALTLLFSCVFVPVATGNDKKFDTYINMGENARKNNYSIPNLFRQDSVYSNVSKFPLVVKDGTEYVPLSMFILYPYVEASYSDSGESFFLLNTKSNRYISFNVSEGVASTDKGDLFRLPVYIFNSTRYIPARKVAEVLGFKCEHYDMNGIYAFRVYDSKSSKTLADIISPYLAKYPVQDDPIQKLGKRRVEFCYTDISSDSMTHILNTLDSYRVAASFSLSEEDVLERTDFVRRIYVSGHKLLVTSRAEGKTPEEYAHSYVAGLEKANKALGFVLKRTTRMCTLPADIPEKIKNSKEFTDAVKAAGYLIFTPNLETDDCPGFTGGAYEVSSKIKNTITDGYAKDEEADISVLLWCSDKTPYYTADVANLINKYEQFEFCTLNEAFVYNKGE